ncbi:MAG: Signal peptidase I [Candidatus Woesebacteria bacterium GW2011_GWF2_46_8]|uniref:Signal peptidase I n=5 Tax=Candidatus Woeseibacteriota TaxID=1752722 RepID=A0A0G1T235_9BACT|nr:MAG: Signal peptidase I [Candidatus Woesebacteria bacterium GW2011_GWF2_46_8]
MINMFKRLGAFFLDIIEVIVFAVAIFLFVYLLIMQPHKIKGASMHPNFPDGEYLLTDKVSYRFGEPNRGDVVVFKAPTNNGEEFIKRIIGLPGERVSIKNGKIYINEELLEEKYLDPTVYSSAGNFLQEGATVVIPGGEYFVLGDNRSHSSDSRAWGSVEKKEITGRAWLVYWPPKSAGVVVKEKY